MSRISIFVLSVLLIISSLKLSGQGIFTSGLSESEKVKTSKLDIGGYMRGTLYSGWDNNDKAAIKSGYAETALKLSAKSNQWGKAFADIRFRTGLIDNLQTSIFDVREAYVDLYLNKFDFRFGKQIKAWGRADVFHPTQNLTPEDYFMRSPANDDRRLGNLAMTGKFRPSSALLFELDWVPFYRPSIYRFEMLDLPDIVKFADGDFPLTGIKNGSFGAKADLILNKLEASVSYFTGYDAMPGLIPAILPQPPFTDFSITLAPKAFRQSTIGGDFATNIGGFGFRGEFAWKKPVSDPLNPAVPMEEVSWAIGIDRALGSFRVLVEYFGKNIQGFSHLDPPGEFNPAILQDPNTWPFLESMLAGQIGYYNRILFDQTDEWLHSVLIRPSLTLLYETLDLEFAALYNISTKEYLLRPVVSYQLADGIECLAGYEYYYGPENTRFDWISKLFSGPFAEIKISF